MKKLPVFINVFILVCCLAISSHSYEQPLKTLDDMIAYAAENHPSIIAAMAEQEAQEAKIPQVRSLPDPTASLQATTMENRVGVGLTQVFPLAGRRNLRGNSAAEMARASQRKVDAAALKVAYEVTRAYSELAYIVLARERVSEILGLVRQLEKMTLTLYRTGDVPHADVVRALLETGRIEDELRSLNDVEEAALARLNAALGLPVDNPLPLPGDLPAVKLNLNAKNVSKTLSVNSPELKSLEHRIAAARYDLEIASRNKTPDLMVGVELMYSSEMNKTDVGGMIGFSLPIGRARREGEIREAVSSLRSVEATRREAGLKLDAEIRMALFQFKDAQRKEELYEKRLLPQAEQALEAMRTAYRAGENPFGELLFSTRLLLEFRLSIDRARADQLIELARLEMLTGQRLRP